MEGPRTEKQRTRCVRQLEFCSVMAMVCHRRTDFSALRLYKPSRHLKPLISHRHPPLAIPNIQRTCVSPSSPSRLRAPPASAPAPSPTGSARQVRVPLHFPIEWYTGLIATCRLQHRRRRVLCRGGRHLRHSRRRSCDARRDSGMQRSAGELQRRMR